MSDANVFHYSGFVAEPDLALQEIQEQVEFVQRTVKLYGKEHQVPRLEAWYGEQSYTFSGHTFPAVKLPPVLDALRIRVECKIPNFEVTGVLVNLYRDGRDSVSWHSDDEDDMGQEPVIASVSLGAPRDMLFRRKGSKTAPVGSAVAPNRMKYTLKGGDLMVMGAGVQEEWEHSIPKRKKAGLRVNLTFRGRLTP